MVKILLTLAILIFPAISNAQVIGDVQISGDNPYTFNATVDSSEFSDPANYFCLVIDTDLSELQFGSVIEPFVVGENSITDTFTVDPATETIYVNFLPLDDNSECDYQLYGEQGGQVFNAPFTEEESGMTAIMETAEENFALTTGFSLAGLVSWSSDGLIKVFLGSGVALLYNLRYWLAAIVMIAVVIYFAFRFFRFFRA